MMNGTQSISKGHVTRGGEKPALLVVGTSKLHSGQFFFFADVDGGNAIHCMTVPPRPSRYSTHPINGIVLMDFGLTATLCNPSTKKTISLPLICPLSAPQALSTFFCVNSLGFDHFSNQFKVLNSWVIPGKKTDYRLPGTVEYRMFTLGENSWKKIEGGPALFPQRESVCLDGVIYFRSYVSSSSANEPTLLVAFDICAEKFDVIKFPDGVPNNADTSCMVNYAGRLAIIDSRVNDENMVSVWVSQTNEHKVWIRETYDLSSNLSRFGFDKKDYSIGAIYTGEILLAPRNLMNPFYVFYYNPKTERMRRIEILGLPDYDPLDLFCNDVSVTVY